MGNTDNKEWREELEKSLKSMQLGFSGSQVEWIEDFIQTLLDRERVEVLEEIKGRASDYAKAFGGKNFRFDNSELEEVIKKIVEAEFKLLSKEDGRD